MLRVGAGPRAIIALPGWTGDTGSWSAVFPYRPESVSLYAIDMPGYGLSAPPAGYSLDAFGDDLASRLTAALDDWGLETVEIAGNCSGAVLGLLAMQRPAFGARVTRIVMVDPFAFMPWYLGLFLWPVVGRLFYYSTFANPLGRVLTNLGLAKHRAEGTDMTRGFTQANHEMILKYLAILGACEPASRFHGITAAVDIATGAKTFSAIRASVPLWQAALPQATTTVLDGAGHLPIQEAAAAVARLLFDGPQLEERPTFHVEG